MPGAKNTLLGTILFSLLSIQSAAAAAPTDQQILSALEDYVDAPHLEPNDDDVIQPKSLTDILQGQNLSGFYNYYREYYPNDNATPTASKIEVAVENLFESGLLVDSLLPETLSILTSFQSGDDEYSAIGRTVALMLLHPYIKDAGACTADGDTEICSFQLGRSGSPAIQAAAELRSSSGDLIQTPQNLNATSTLGNVFDTLSNNCSRQAAFSEPSSQNENESSSNLISAECFGFDYRYVYSYRWQTKWYGTTRVWALAVGYATGQFLATVGDTVTVVTPAALRCGRSCLLKSIFSCFDDFTSGNSSEGILCVAKKATKKNYRVLTNTAITHAHARICNVTQARAENRYLFEAYESGEFGNFVPDEARTFINESDLTFQTNHQTGLVDDYDSRNYFPRPSFYDLDVAGKLLGKLSFNRVPKWHHFFSEVRAWDFNVIYGGANTLPNIVSGALGNTCAIAMTHPVYPSLVAAGDQFMIFSSAGSALPAMNVIFGLSTSHPVFTCLSQSD
jgi:hypothetical protein